MALPAGARIGRFEIVALIGAGGMGRVYRARDPHLGRDVAIKVVVERFNDRFSREAHAVAALNHPNVATLHDVGPDYLVMELVDGPTLAERIARGALPDDEAIGIARQLASGLEAAHDQAIVHRDLKPANIKVTPNGTVKLLDFGLAKIADVAAVAATESDPVDANGRPDDERGDRARHRSLHVDGAGARPGSRQTNGHLGVRVRALRDAHGSHALRSANGARHHRRRSVAGSGLDPTALYDQAGGAPAPATLPREGRADAPAGHRRRAPRARRTVRTAGRRTDIRARGEESPEPSGWRGSSRP